jgi:hypothetical protein
VWLALFAALAEGWWQASALALRIPRFHWSPARCKRRQEFQLLTPQVIAAVRGTKWAMEVTPGQTSTLVLLGQVSPHLGAANELVAQRASPGEGRF